MPGVAQAALPFASKPKQQVAAKRANLDQRRAVVREPHERRVAGLIGQLQALRNQRADKRRAANDARRQARLLDWMPPAAGSAGLRTCWLWPQHHSAPCCRLQGGQGTLSRVMPCDRACCPPSLALAVRLMRPNQDVQIALISR